MVGPLTVQELDSSLKFIVKIIQQQEFPKEMAEILSGKILSIKELLTRNQLKEILKFVMNKNNLNSSVNFLSDINIISSFLLRIHTSIAAEFRKKQYKMLNTIWCESLEMHL